MLSMQIKVDGDTYKRDRFAKKSLSHISFGASLSFISEKHSFLKGFITFENKQEVLKLVSLH